MTTDSPTAGVTSRSRMEKSRLYLRIGLLTGSAVVICTAIITYFNGAETGSLLADVGSAINLAAVTLLPYMISAVVAASTAIAVMTILPTARAVDPAERIIDRLKELSAGNLTSRLTVAGDSNLKEIAGELNRAVTNLGNQLTSLKIINRQQWGSLCGIRGAADHNDSATVLRYVEEMERNWKKIAEIEERLST
ncbi:MAG: hypothetical protein AB1644_02910 [Candidatus Zixiibacteriota bacterium]